MYSIRSSRSRMKLTPHRIGIVLISLSLIWGLYLMKIQMDERTSQPDYLKARIIQLSKEYIQALARTKNFEGIDGQAPNGLSDLKATTALLLENMMSRIDTLERQVESVIINSTLDFETLQKKIESLNNSRQLVNINKTKDRNRCSIPDNPNYPECLNKAKWLKDNWRTDPKYSKSGVNGSLCSIINYLSQVENWCPGKPQPTLDCEIPRDPAFPHCVAKIQWMKKFWKSDPKYQGSGVDGSDCSILYYLSEVESWCPLIPGRKFKSDCEVPNSPSHPSCIAKVAWMRNFWKSDACYAQDHGVNGTICSFLVYLSEVENWCPLLPNRRKPTEEFRSQSKLKKQDLDRQDINKLFALLHDKNPIKFKWIKSRISHMWPDWLNAMNRFKSTNNITDNAVQKKILIHIGVLAGESSLHFAATAGKGGPLGELIQWSDLITSLYLLGHDIVVTADIIRLKESLGKTGVKRKSCPTRITNDFDLIYLDYYGIRQMMLRIGQLMPVFKCKFRILDSFGTEAQFNYAGFTEKIAGGSMGIWGRHNLNLLQFMTMFPHSPDNSFLGFVVGKPAVLPTPLKKRKPRALIYGKHYSMWKDFKNKSFLDVINKYLEIHATVGGGPESQLHQHIPSYVINHGVLPAVEVQKLLQDTMVFVGLGFPYEGPAPLEAIANGCFFLNPKYVPPRNRINTKFFKDKPTIRKLTSQHPYAEEYIAEPYVYTVNIDKTSEVDAVMQKIMLSKPVDPYLPFEFTHEGMLERIHKFVQNQDFCGHYNWPPRNVVKPVVGKISKSCKETCHENELVCEPHLFREINTSEQMTRAGLPCNTTKSAITPSLVAPGYRTDTPVCLIQAQSLLYSCTASSPTTKRLCPCRSFKPGQVALCKTC